MTDGCEPPCGCWELNSGPLEEQAMLLTTEPSLQPCLLLFKKIFIYYVYNIPEGQKRAPDLITDGCEPPCGCWELNSGPLEEQAMLLTAEPSLQPSDLLRLKFHMVVNYHVGAGN